MCSHQLKIKCDILMCPHRSEYVKGVTSRRVTFIKCVESVDEMVLSPNIKNT